MGTIKQKIVLVGLYDIYSYSLRIFQSILMKAGFDVHAIFAVDEYSGKRLIDKEVKVFVQSVIRQQPDIICFSVRSPFFSMFKTIVRELKKHHKFNASIVVGGHHATVCPEDFEGFADAVCVGEGEDALLEYCKYERGDGIWEPTPLMKDLDSLPFPYYGPEQEYLFCDPGYKTQTKLSVYSSRGCVFNCSYCYNTSLRGIYGKDIYKVRRRSVDKVIEEIEMLQSKFSNLEEIVISDNVFATDLKWVSEFCSKFKKLGLTFRCFGSWNSLSKDMLATLKEGGCKFLTIGFQSGSEKVRKEILHRYEKNKTIIEKQKWIADSGIIGRFDYILNIPYYEEEHKLESEKLITKFTRPFVIRYFPLIHHPNTDLTKVLLEDGIIDKTAISGINDTAYKKVGKFVYYPKPLPKLPSVSVSISTFGREEILAKTIEQFLAQNYGGDMELVISNDNPDVKLIHSDKRIRIINHNRRFTDLSEKHRLCVNECRNDLISRWSDDDIWMPWAISTMVKYLGDKNVMWFVPYRKTKVRPPGIKLAGDLKHDPLPNGVVVYRRKWHEALNLPYKNLINEVLRPDDYNIATLKPEEVFFSWIVDPSRRDSWEPSEESKYQVMDRNPTVVKLGICVR